MSQLYLNEDESAELIQDLDAIVRFVDVMQKVNTDDVEPLAHPLDLTQNLREDEPDSSIDRDQFQALSKATRDGLYVVPLVIESS